MSSIQAWKDSRFYTNLHTHFKDERTSSQRHSDVPKVWSLMSHAAGVGRVPIFKFSRQWCFSPLPHPQKYAASSGKDLTVWWGTGQCSEDPTSSSFLHAEWIPGQPDLQPLLSAFHTPFHWWAGLGCSGCLQESDTLMRSKVLMTSFCNLSQSIAFSR